MTAPKYDTRFVMQGLPSEDLPALLAAVDRSFDDCLDVSEESLRTLFLDESGDVICPPMIRAPHRLLESIESYLCGADDLRLHPQKGVFLCYHGKRQELSIIFLMKLDGMEGPQAAQLLEIGCGWCIEDGTPEGEVELSPRITEVMLSSGVMSDAAALTVYREYATLCDQLRADLTRTCRVPERFLGRHHRA